MVLGQTAAVLFGQVQMQHAVLKARGDVLLGDTLADIEAPAEAAGSKLSISWSAL